MNFRWSSIAESYKKIKKISNGKTKKFCYIQICDDDAGDAERAGLFGGRILTLGKP